MDEHYLEHLNETPEDSFLESLRAYGAELKVPLIQKDGLDFLIMLLKLSRAKRVLEIGSAIGYAAIAIAKFTEAEVVGIEIDAKLANIAIENCRETGLSEKVQIIHDDALKVDAKSLGSFDAIFIDAAKSQYIHYFVQYADCLKTGGFFVSDNLLFRGHVEAPETIISRNRRQLVGKIKNYNTWLKENPGFYTRFYEVGDGIAVSVKL